MKALKIDDVAKRMGCATKAATSRLVALGYTKVCSRCGGSGLYSFTPMHGSTCFGCGGNGLMLAPITEAVLSEALVRIEDGALVPYFAENAAKKQIKAARGSVWQAYQSSALAKAYSVRSTWKAMQAAGLDHAAFLQTPVYRAQHFLGLLANATSDIDKMKLTAVDKVARFREVEAAIKHVDAAWIAFDKP